MSYFQEENERQEDMREGKEEWLGILRNGIVPYKFVSLILYSVAEIY